MPRDEAERSPIGRSVLGGASCGLTYDAALLDAEARESRLRRPLRLRRWTADASDRASSQPMDRAEPAAPARTTTTA